MLKNYIRGTKIPVKYEWVQDGMTSIFVDDRKFSFRGMSEDIAKQLAKNPALYTWALENGVTK